MKNGLIRESKTVWFYGISTIVGYLMPVPLYTYIGCVNIHGTHVTVNKSTNNVLESKSFKTLSK